MQKALVSTLILIVFVTGCTTHPAPSQVFDTPTPGKLPPTWTIEPTITSTSMAVFTPTPTATPTEVISEFPYFDFEGAEGWWLRLPNASLVHASGTNDGGMLLFVRISQEVSDDYYTLMSIKPDGNVNWQRAVEGIRYPTGVLETLDGGILITEYTKLHKLTAEGEPQWTRAYHYSEIGRQAELFGPIGKITRFDNNTQIIGLYGDITTLDQEGAALDVELVASLAYTLESDESIASAIPGGSYFGEQESRTVYKLTRRNKVAPAWEARFDFINFDITLFPPHFVLGTDDGGVLFIGTAPHTMNDGGFAIFIARLGRAGNVYWQRIYRGIYEGDFYAFETSEGGFLIANRHTFYGDPYTGSFLRMTRFNSSGYIVWDRVYGNGETQIQVKNIIEKSDGGFFLVGQHQENKDNDIDTGIAVLSVDSQGRIPGCKFLAEVEKADILGKSPEASLTQLSPSTSRDGELIPGESTSIEFSLKNINLPFEVICSYPAQDFLSEGEIEEGAERIHTFADNNGLIIGAVQGDVWYSASEAVTLLPEKPSYRMYNLTSYTGNATGQLSSSPGRSYCPTNSYLAYETGDAPPFNIALDGNWNAIPQIPTELSNTITSYRDVVLSLLKKNGLKNAEVSIDHIYQIDLDGDGVDEILISANHYAKGLRGEGVSEGDYSLLLLRTIQGSVLKTVPLYERYITEDSQYARAGDIEIVSLLDFNGDGNMEILAWEKFSKAYRYHIYDPEGDPPGDVLQLYCGE